MSYKSYTTVSNPRYFRYDNSIILMEVNFDHLPEESVEFIANPNDVEPHGVELYNRAVAGDFGPVAAFVVPDPISGDRAMELLRDKRAGLLAETDWWAVADRTMTSEEITYRQALRDLPQDFPNAQVVYNTAIDDWEWTNLTLPTKPE